MRRHWRLRGLTLLDQGLSSLSNVLAVVLVARSLDTESFGLFSVAYGVLLFVLTLSRTFFGTQLSLARTPEEGRSLGGAVSGALMLLSPAIVVVVAGMGVVLTRAQWVSLVLVVAAATPVICLQDCLRFTAVTTDRPGAAVVSDGLWCGIILAAIVVGTVLDAAQVLGLWLGAAGAALVTLLALLRLRPRVMQGLALLRTRHHVGESLTVGVAASSGASLVVIALVANVLSPAAAGALRGASTLMGPLNALFAFIAIGLTPAVVRRPRRQDVRTAAAVAAGAVTTVAAWGLVLLALPADLGSAVLGDTWASARAVLPFTTLEYVALAAGAASTLGLKVRSEARALARQKLGYAVGIVIVGGATALAAQSVLPVAAALAVVAAAANAYGWVQLLRSARVGLQE
jgi:hypothetical protein